MAAGRRTEEGERVREGAERKAGRPAIKQSLCIDAAATATGGGGRRRRRTRWLPRSFNGTAARRPLLPSACCTPTKISTTTTKSVLSMNDGRIDHNFRRRESIRGSADSGRQDEEAGGGRDRGGQKKAIAREEGRKIEKRRRRRERGRGRSRRRKRSQGGIKGAAFGNTGFLSEIGTKLRDWAVGQAGGS